MFSLACAGAYATDYTWNGSVDQQWRRAANWTTTTNDYPDNGHAAVIFDGTALTPSTISTTWTNEIDDLMSVDSMLFRFGSAGGTWRLANGAYTSSTIIVISQIEMSGTNRTVQFENELSFVNINFLDVDACTAEFEDRYEGFSNIPFLPPVLALNGKPAGKVVFKAPTLLQGQILWRGAEIQTLDPGALTNTTLSLGTNFDAVLDNYLNARVAAIEGGAGSTLHIAHDLQLGQYIESSPDVFDGAITGDVTITKITQGSIRFTAQQPFAGTFLLQDGELQLVYPDALQYANLDLAGGTLSLANFNFGLGNLEFGNLSGSGDFNIGTNDLTVGGQGPSVQYSGSISGTADVHKVGNGTWELPSGQDFSGTMHIEEGSVRIAPTALQDQSVVIESNASLQTLSTEFPTILTDVSGSGLLQMNSCAFQIDDATDVQFDGHITGDTGTTGNFWKRGTGTLTLSAASNDFTGGTLITEGGLVIGADAALGATSEEVTVGFGAQLRVTNTTTSTRPWESTTAASHYDVDTGMTWTIGGPLTDQVTSQTRFGGGGTIVLAEAQTPLGSFYIDDAGTTLLLENGGGSALGDRPLTMAAGTKLGGSGTHLGSVTAPAGTEVSPGASFGELTLGALALDGKLSIEVLGEQSDRLTVTGLLDIAGAELHIEWPGGDLSTGAYVIASYGALNGTFTNVDVPFNYELQYGAGASGKEIHFIQKTNDPYVISMDSSSPGFSSDTQVVYTIVFSEDVQPPTTNDFYINFTGFSIGTPVITGTGTTWYVTINVAGSGTLTFDIADGQMIQDLEGNPLTKRTTPIVSEIAQYQRIYVSKDGASIPPFSEWATAATNLQDALSLAQSNEIWVAEGVYTPGPNRTNTFQLKSGVVMYGGFLGDELVRIQRDPNPLFNGTILSGDIGVESNDSDNCYNVVTMTGAGSSALIDGFMIRDGNGYGSYGTNFNGGAGVLGDGSGDAQIVNCAVIFNRGAQSGGVYVKGGSPRFENCFISLNEGELAGGVQLLDSSATFVNCQLDGNHSTRNGGGIRVAGYSEPKFINCTVAGNLADDRGGGFENVAAMPSFFNTVVWSNEAAMAAFPIQPTWMHWTTVAIYTNSLMQYAPKTILDTSGSGNLDGAGSTNDPKFVEWANVYKDPTLPGYYKGQPGTSLIDKGLNSLNDTLFDLDGNARIANSTIDIGAYEGTALYDQPPACTAIVADVISPANVTTITFTVYFDESVYDVTTNAFDVYLAGSLDFTSMSLAGTDAVYDVTLAGLHGAGALYMTVDIDDTIVDSIGQLLATSAVSDIVEIDADARVAITGAGGTDFVFNAYDVDAGFAISGTTTGIPPGQPVFLLVSDTNGHAVQTWTIVQYDGTWTALFGTNTVAVDKLLVNNANQERDPKAALLAGGGMVVTWWVNGPGNDGTDRDIYAAVVDVDGSIAIPPFQVSDSDTNVDWDCDVDGLDDGGWVIVWRSYESDPSGEDSVIMMQRYDENGTPIGSNTLVSTMDTNRDSSPAVAWLADGGWIVAWQAAGGIGDDGGDYEIVAQRYNAAGNPVGGIFKADDPDGNATDATPDLYSHPDGGWVMSWQGWDIASGNWDVYCNHYDAGGTNLTGDIPVDGGVTDTTHETGSAIATLRNGGWVVSWASSGNETNLIVEMFSPDGVIVTNDTANEPGQLDTGQYGLDSLDNGGYAIAFRRGYFPAQNDIVQQVYETNGAPFGPLLPVDAPDGGGFDARPTMAALYDGGWFVVWENGTGLSLQRFNFLGQPLFDQVDVSSLEPGPITISVTAYAANDAEVLAAASADYVALTPYQVWADSFGLSGTNRNFDADPNTNGFPNIFEFGVNGNPLSNVADGKRRVLRAPVDGTNRFVLTFPARSGAAFAGSSSMTAAVDGVHYTVSGALALPDFDQAVMEAVPALTSGMPSLDTGWDYHSFHLHPSVPAVTSGFISIDIENAEDGN